MANSYLVAWKIRRRHRRAEQGLLRAWIPLLPVVATVIAAPLLKDVFLHFLDSPERLNQGGMGFAMRLGWFCCGAMALRSYSALVRSPERAILDPHPGNPVALLRYLTLKCGWESRVLLLCAISMLWPVAGAGHWALFAVGAAVVVVGWLLGLMVGFPVHLAAVWAAESPGLSSVMEALRGANPRLQAALIYAPGLVLALGGIGVWTVAQAGESWLSGNPSAPWLAVIPLLMLLVAWAVSAPLARGFHYRTTTLLAEIDGHYARLEDPEAQRIVYLEWAIRPLPSAWRPYLLRDLRHGWRGLRSWITGAWGIGVLVALSALSGDPQAFGRCLAIGGGGLVLIAGVGIQLECRNPLWLEKSLPITEALAPRTRLVVLWLWLQGAILLGCGALAWRRGAGEGWLLFSVLQVLALLLAVLATYTGRWRERAWAAYIPSALLIWSGLLGAMT